MEKGNEFKVGLMVIAGFLLLLSANWVIKGVNLSSEGYPLFASFRTLSGIDAGSDVRLADGIRIGKVKKVELTERGAIIEMWIRRDVKLLSGSRATISSSSMLGEQFISVFPPREGGTQLADGAVLPSDEPLSLMDGIREFGQLMKNVNAVFGDEEGKPVLNDIGTSLRESLRSVEQLFDRNRAEIDATIANLNRASREAAGLLRQLNLMLSNGTKGPSLLHALLDDKQAYVDFRLILDNLKHLTLQLRRDPSILIWRDRR